MRSILALATIAGFLMCGAARADAPLRHLEFVATLDAYTNTSHTILGAMGGESDVGPAQGVVHATGSVAITVDVMRAFDDGGLLVAISERTDAGTKGPLSVGINSDGSLIAAASAIGALEPEERALLPLLARGILAGKEVAAGNGWRLDTPTDHDLDRSFAVAVDSVEGDLAELTIKSSEVAKNLGGTRSQFDAKVSYQLKRQIPVSISLVGLTITDTNDTSQKTRLSATYTLRADSMAR